MGWSGATPVLSWKDSVRVATAAALPAVTYANGTAGVGATLTADAVGVLTVDGIATVLGDRILVKNQVAGLQNGVYSVTVEGTGGVAAVLTRAPTSDEAAEVPSEAVFAQEGTANADSGYTQTVDAPVTMGTTALVYVQFTGLGQITAGTGMTKTGNTLNVIGGTGITANADDIQTDPGCDSTAIHDNVAGEITAITEKTTLTATEIVLIEDPADSDNKKRVQLSNLPAGSTALLVRKGSAGTIAKGSPVYISGFNVGQNVPEVEEAKADAAGTMPAIGIAAESITNSANATVTVTGRVAGFDTSSFSVGDRVYVSAATAGTLTATRPTGATDLIQIVGEVLRDHASLGELEAFGAGRSNALSNLPNTQVFVGDANSLPTATATTGTGNVVRATSPALTTPTIVTSVHPDSDDGAVLGSPGTAFSDLALATGAVIDLGNGNYTVTHSTGLLTFSGDAKVAGNLIVEGTTTTVDSETVMVADNHLYLNSGYTTDAAQTGGLVVNVDPTTTTDTVAGAFVAGVPATSNPTVTTTGSATFSVGELIQISGSTSNDGLYEVLTHSGTTLTIRGIGLTATVEDFTQNDFTAEAGAGAITKTAVAVLRAGTDGVWETAFNSATGSTFSNVASVSNKLDVFAATTSAELATVISDNSGSGSLVFSTGPNLFSPVIATPNIDAGTVDSLTSLSIRSTGAAFDLTLATATVFTAGRALTIDPGDAARTVTLSGNPTLADWFDQSVKTAANPTFGNLTITSFAANWTNAGRTVADLGVVTTVDIDGGTIDGVTIGGVAAGAITGTTITSSGDVLMASSGSTNMLFLDVSEDHVVMQKDNGTNPAIGTATVLLLSNNSVAGDSAGFSINSGTTGQAFINFGDTADENAGFITYKNDGDTMEFEVATVPILKLGAGVVTATGDVNPEADGTRDLGIQTTAQWANVWADLINGADIAMANKWRMVESELYDGYGEGWAVGHNDAWVDGKSIWAAEDGDKDAYMKDAKPTFVVTDEFLEYRGRRITPEALDKLLELAEAS